MDRGRRGRHGELPPRRVRLFDERAFLRRVRPSGWLAPVCLAAPRRSALDTSVLLAACASERGASRELFHRCRAQGWRLISTPYAIEEVARNLPKFPLAASAEWVRLRSHLRIRDNVLTLDRRVVFPAGKDRPILFGALAWAEVLLTLDRWDFASLLGTSFYGLLVLKPGVFLKRERAAGRLPAK